jgi:hypothetical protein
MVWREAPALADPFRSAQKRAAPHRYTAPAGGGKTPKGGWFVTSLGGERERGVWRNQKGISVRFQTPLSHVWPAASASLRRP